MSGSYELNIARNAEIMWFYATELIDRLLKSMIKMQKTNKKSLPKQKILCNLINILSKFQSFLLWFSTDIDIMNVTKIF